MQPPALTTLGQMITANADMPTPLRTLPIATLAAVLLAGCAGSSDAYPSLAIREAERVSGEFTPATPDTSPAPVASGEDISAILDQAKGAHRIFQAEQPGAQQLARAAAGAGIESAEYARALVALAQLTSLRGQTVIAMSNLDDLEVKAATGFAPTEGIRAAQAEIAMLVNEQTITIDSLAAVLETPAETGR